MHFQHKECPIIYYKRPTTQRPYIIVLGCCNTVLTMEASLLPSLSLIRWKHQKNHHDIINFVSILFLSKCYWFGSIKITTTNNIIQGSNTCHHYVLRRLLCFGLFQHNQGSTNATDIIIINSTVLL